MIACEDDVAIWRATEERARTREAFLRSVRSTLKRLASASRAAERLRRVSAEGSLASPRRRRQRGAPALPPPPVAPMLALDAGEPAESDVKVITLGNSLGRARAPSRLQVVKD